MRPKVAAIIETLDKLPRAEVHALVATLRDKWSVPEDVEVVQQPIEAPAPVKQEFFDVILIAAPAPARIKIIQEIRKLLDNQSLTQIRDLIDKAPVPIKTEISQADAEKLLQQLQAVGAIGEIR